MSATLSETGNNLPPRLGLNRIEAAKALGVSPATLDRLAQRGLIRPCRATYRPIYWVKELERFLKENSKAACAATERAGASESTLTSALKIEVAKN